MEMVPVATKSLPGVMAHLQQAPYTPNTHMCEQEKSEPTAVGAAIVIKK